MFLQRQTQAELDDTFGGIAATQEVVAALESGDVAKQAVAEEVSRLTYAPVLDVHWVTVKQLSRRPSTPWVSRARRPGHADGARPDRARQRAGVGDNPFSDACLMAMDYGREKLIKDDWKSIFADDELDHVLKQMLHLDHIHD